VVISDDKYLLKMHEDFDLLAEVQPLVDALKIPEDKVGRRRRRRMMMMMMMMMRRRRRRRRMMMITMMMLIRRSFPTSPCAQLKSNPLMLSETLTRQERRWEEGHEPQDDGTSHRSVDDDDDDDDDDDGHGDEENWSVGHT
jgi:hypothetical protein